MTSTGRIIFALNDLRELEHQLKHATGARVLDVQAELKAKRRELSDLEAAWFAGRAILASGRAA